MDSKRKTDGRYSGGGTRFAFMGSFALNRRRLGSAVSSFFASSSRLGFRVLLLAGLCLSPWSESVAAPEADVTAGTAMESSQLGVEVLLRHREGVQDLFVSLGPGAAGERERLLMSFDGDVAAVTGDSGGVLDVAALLTSPAVNEGLTPLFSAPLGLLMLVAGIYVMLKPPSLGGRLRWLVFAVMFTVIPVVLGLLGQSMCSGRVGLRSTSMFAAPCAEESGPANTFTPMRDKQEVFRKTEAIAGPIAPPAMAALQAQLEEFDNHSLLQLDTAVTPDCRFVRHFTIRTSSMAVPRFWTERGEPVRVRSYVISASGAGSMEPNIAFQDRFSAVRRVLEEEPETFRARRSTGMVSFPPFTNLLWDGCYLTVVEGTGGELFDGTLDGEHRSVLPHALTPWFLFERSSYLALLVLAWFPLLAAGRWGTPRRRLGAYAGVLGLTAVGVGIYVSQAWIVPSNSLLSTDSPELHLRQELTEVVQAQEAPLRGKTHAEQVQYLDALLGSMVNAHTGLPLRDEASLGNYEVLETADGVCVRYYDFPYCGLDIGAPELICVESS
jgi:hypothetical protein